MSTQRDLVQAHQFDRRRLVSAFVSGATGARVRDAGTDTRALLGGLALAALVAVGGAASARMSGEGALERPQPGLVVSRETGQAYVASEAGGAVMVRPVANPASARLLLGPDLEPQVVAQESIESLEAGAPVGIPGAPTVLPDPDALVGTGWTACTHEGSRVRLTIGGRAVPAVADGVAFVVESAGAPYLLAHTTGGARAYRLPDDPAVRQGLLADLGLVTVQAQEVSAVWLALWPTGDGPSPQALDLPLTPGEGRPCARLDARPDAPPSVSLAARPDNPAAHPGPREEAIDVSVPPRGGAYVATRAASGDTATYLVDATGTTYLVEGPDAAANLGYAGYAAPVVPASWLALLPEGPRLSVADALGGAP